MLLLVVGVVVVAALRGPDLGGGLLGERRDGVPGVEGGGRVLTHHKKLNLLIYSLDIIAQQKKTSCSRLDVVHTFTRKRRVGESETFYRTCTVKYY